MIVRIRKGKRLAIMDVSLAANHGSAVLPLFGIATASLNMMPHLPSNIQFINELQRCATVEKNHPTIEIFMLFIFLTLIINPRYNSVILWILFHATLVRQLLSNMDELRVTSFDQFCVSFYTQ